MKCDYCSKLRTEVWTALCMIRDAIETLGPVGVLRSAEFVGCHPGDNGHILAEADELVSGIAKIVNGGVQMSEKLDYCIKKYTTCIALLDKEEKDAGLDSDQEYERENYKLFLKELKQIKDEIS